MGNLDDIWQRIQESSDPRAQFEHEINLILDKKGTIKMLIQDGVEQKIARDWLQIRRVKRLPLTSRSWEAIKEEAALACMSLNEAIDLCVKNSWAGFKHTWVKQVQRPSKQARIESSNHATRHSAADAIRRMM